jgi:hypothetical protein
VLGRNTYAHDGAMKRVKLDVDVHTTADTNDAKMHLPRRVASYQASRTACEFTDRHDGKLGENNDLLGDCRAFRIEVAHLPT